MLRLFVGGMKECSKEHAIFMLLTDSKEGEYVDFPKILFALGEPVVWFWGKHYTASNTSPLPNLPDAFNPSFFSIVYDYKDEELFLLMKKYFAQTTENK